ncbi:hypothetical protein GCM10010446_28950 [Streptomyces enissocaesilis]|uniref:Uncharacterized protein n=1 Tax=Streptomyces enissocaesilis TaxID=332589 RepID=A0ABN3X7R4_9ACTN
MPPGELCIPARKGERRDRQEQKQPARDVDRGLRDPAPGARRVVAEGFAGGEYQAADALLSGAHEKLVPPQRVSLRRPGRGPPFSGSGRGLL